MERVRFRQGLRSNPQGLALTGSHARLGSKCFGGKTGGVRVVAALSSLRVEGSVGLLPSRNFRTILNSTLIFTISFVTPFAGSGSPKAWCTQNGGYRQFHLSITTYYRHSLGRFLPVFVVYCLSF